MSRTLRRVTLVATALAAVLFVTPAGAAAGTETGNGIGAPHAAP